MNDEQVLSSLPMSVREMVDHLGLSTALTIVRLYGGTTWRVPLGVREDGAVITRLKEHLGEDAAQRLVACYGGEHLTVARCAQALRDARDKNIQRDYDNGRPVSALSREYSLTERQVWTILKRDLSVHNESLQGCLF